jgi:hypothetical protein
VRPRLRLDDEDKPTRHPSCALRSPSKTKIDRVALAILVFGGAGVMSGVGGIHVAEPPATFTSLPRLAEVDAEALRKPAKHYDAETAMAEAREAAAHIASAARQGPVAAFTSPSLDERPPLARGTRPQRCAFP